MCRLRRRHVPHRLIRCALSHGALGLALAACATTADHAPFAFAAPSQPEVAGLPLQEPSPAWVGASRRLSGAEEEAVIAAAIAEHEMRRP